MSASENVQYFQLSGNVYVVESRLLQISLKSVLHLSNSQDTAFYPFVPESESSSHW